MAEIHEYTSVHCPFEELTKYLKEYFDRHGGRDGVGATVDLKAPLGDLHLEKNVVASINPVKGYPGYDRFSIGWDPQGGGPYPTFEGTLSVSEESIGYSRIDLDGSYAPPGGPIGAAFDAAIGHRIAGRTAALLLEHFKESIEAGYAADHGLPVPRSVTAGTVEDA